MAEKQDVIAGVRGRLPTRPQKFWVSHLRVPIVHALSPASATTSFSHPHLASGTPVGRHHLPFAPPTGICHHNLFHPRWSLFLFMASPSNLEASSYFTREVLGSVVDFVHFPSTNFVASRRRSP